MNLDDHFITYSNERIGSNPRSVYVPKLTDDTFDRLMKDPEWIVNGSEDDPDIYSFYDSSGKSVRLTSIPRKGGNKIKAILSSSSAEGLKSLSNELGLPFDGRQVRFNGV